MGNADNDSSVSEFAKLIPEAYFDLICRLTPGAMFIFGAIYIFKIPLADNWYHSVPALLFASYFAGYVLDAFSHFCSEYFVDFVMLWRVKRTLTDNQKITLSDRCGINKTLEGTNKYSRARVFELLRADLRHSSPENTPVMGKLVAESRLLNTSAFGIPILLMICHINRSGEWQDVDTNILLTAIVLEVLILLGWWQRIKRSALRTVFRWLKECN